MAFRLTSIACAITLSLAATNLITTPALAGKSDHAYKPTSAKQFERIATFPVYKNSDIDEETVAEIVAASEDGQTLIYTDGELESIGFVDITNPAQPQPAGLVDVGGEPTSVAIAGNYALVGVNTSPSFIAPSGELLVLDITTQTIVASYELNGQPDSVAVSPDKRYAAVVIENERDEDLGDGEPPQAPAGFLVIVDLVGEPTDWNLRNVNFTGIADLFPEDPEPEYVDINQFNIASVTLQENNHIILVHLPTGDVINDFNAGTVDLTKIDINENDLIEPVDSLTDIPREPDGITWLSPYEMATADEGDLFGGSRGFTFYDWHGNITYQSGNTLEHLAIRAGHYPEDRSENKGNEPENVESAHYGDEHYLFVGSERANIVFVYQLRGLSRSPRLVQILPAGVGPEGLLAIPERNLFVVASEKDDRGDKFRSSLSIYERTGNNTYPTIISGNREKGVPIPWAALSGLAVDPRKQHISYTVHDSFYEKSRIFVMNTDKQPAFIHREIVLNDSLGQLAAIDPNLVNDDATVNLDLEGIATRQDSGFWLVSEGAGTVGSSSRPFESLNLLLRVSKKGVIEQVVTLPESVNARQIRFGYEGVTTVGSGDNETVYVAFQREWEGDPDDHVRIGQYNTATGEWGFFYYPIETPTSPNGGWVGLSDLSYLGDNHFAVIERDNQGGDDARIKRIYRFSLDGMSAQADPATGEPSFPVINKTLVRDLMSDLQAPAGAVSEKVEGLAVKANGDAMIVNDNDGVDDSNGETQLITIPGLF